MSKLLYNIKKYLAETDLFLIGLCCVATAYGIILVRSATLSLSGGFKLVLIQIIAAVIGFACMVVISKIDYNFLADLWKILLGLSVLAIVFTLIFGTGPVDSGNHNWIKLGPVNIQPSEFVKILFIITFSAHLYAAGDDINSFKQLLFLLMHGGIISLMVLLQGDMGSALVFLFMFIAMMFAAGLKIRYFAIFAGLIVVASPLIWNFVLEGYMKMRILAGFNPEIDPLGAGYQALQSKIAIGSGLVSGKGIFKGALIQLNLVPAKQTDFIFAVAGEELGFLGASLVIIILFALLLRVFITARKTRNDLGSYMIIGVFSMLFFQIFENLGMCVGILPVIGITLPFFSYGGSSIISVFMSIGLVLSVYMRRKVNYI